MPFVSSRLCLSPAGKNLTAFHHWMLHGQVILALVLCAGEPFVGSRLRSSQVEAPTAEPQPWPDTHENSAGPFHVPDLSTGLAAVSAHP